MESALQTFEEDPFDFENWYPSLSKFTFKSTFIPLFEDEAIAIRDNFIKYTLSRESDSLLDDNTRRKVLEKVLP